MFGYYWLYFEMLSVTLVDIVVEVVHFLSFYELLCDVLIVLLASDLRVVLRVI